MVNTLKPQANASNTKATVAVTPWQPMHFAQAMLESLIAPKDHAWRLEESYLALKRRAQILRPTCKRYEDLKRRAFRNARWSLRSVIGFWVTSSKSNVQAFNFVRIGSNISRVWLLSLFDFIRLRISRSWHANLSRKVLQRRPGELRHKPSGVPMASFAYSHGVKSMEVALGYANWRSLCRYDKAM